MSTLESRSTNPISLAQPTLKGLAFLLRHKELWPLGFEWDFGNCDRCAMGLTVQLWSLATPKHDVCFSWSELMMETFDMYDNWSTHKIFVHGSENPGADITPEMVADRIDNYLELHA